MDLEQFKIWMAGFYEGEGSISNDISNNNKLRLSVSQNDPTPLLRAQEVWGGSVRKRVRVSPASDKICTGHEWRINHHQTLQFLEDTRRFMIIPYKINQIEKALQTSQTPLDRRFKCNFCDKDFASPSGRRRHTKANHINDHILADASVSDDESDQETQDFQTAGNS